MRTRNVLIQISFLALAVSQAVAAERTIVVAADGSGQFRTLQEAFAKVPDNSPERTIIHLKPGIYDGQKILEKEKRNVTLRGESIDSTILTWDINTNEEQPAGTNPRYKGTSLVVLADDFRAERLTFRNTSGDHGQALALRIDGDRAVVTDSRLLGWQDTVMLNNGRHYFSRTPISKAGSTSFTAAPPRCSINASSTARMAATSPPRARHRNARTDSCS